MTGLLRGGGGVSQIMTVDDRGEGGCLAYLVSPDDVISGQPLNFFVCLFQGCAILKFLILFGLQYSGDNFATPIPIMILDKVE